MRRAIPELIPRTELFVEASRQTAQFEPAQLDRKDELQKGGKEEGGERNARQSHDRNDIVGLGILLGCRNHTEGNGNEDFDDEGNGAHHKGKPYRVVELVQNGNVPYPAIAEITACHISEPAEKADNGIGVHLVCCRQLLHPFLIRFAGAAHHGLLARHVLDVGRGE